MSNDKTLKFDLSDLTGDVEPVSLYDFLADNRECPIDDSEVKALRACPVAGTINIGIGGGFITVKRVA
jgi:hypothetical protein